MKNNHLKSLGVFVLALSLTTAVFAKDAKVDVTKSVVNWTGKKVTGEHHGTIAIKEGTLALTKDKVTGGKIVIDMQSIANVDLTDPGYNAKLIGHLKSDDFFAVATNPTSELVLTKVVNDGNNLTFNGNLTIKGITQPVTFPATVSKDGKNSVYKGTLTIDRTKYNVRYGSKSFFNDIGDKAIDDNFILDFNLVVTE
ncbi:MAG TPA: YceI family protein [Prolixibacteraceae bacterium]|jgi:polyisoprenoid-binding protein YceI